MEPGQVGNDEMMGRERGKRTVKATKDCQVVNCEEVEKKMERESEMGKCVERERKKGK